MPAGNPSAYGRQQLAAAARATQGVADVLPTSRGGTEGVPAILTALRAGQLSAEQLMQLIALLGGLGGGGLPGMMGGMPQGGSPIEQAFVGGMGGAEY